MEQSFYDIHNNEKDDCANEFFEFVVEKVTEDVIKKSLNVLILIYKYTNLASSIRNPNFWPLKRGATMSPTAEMYLLTPKILRASACFDIFVNISIILVNLAD